MRSVASKNCYREMGAVYPDVIGGFPLLPPCILVELKNCSPKTRPWAPILFTSGFL
jgi:hypothetical protein